MKKQEFIINELNILKELKDKYLEKIIYTDPVFANIELVFKDFILMINNNAHIESFVDSQEEYITYFTVDKLDSNANPTFVINNSKLYSLDVKEKITSVIIVNDLINYNNEYEISYDVAIIFKTDKHEYIISRDWFYMETMDINIDKNVDDVLNKESIIEQYTGDSIDKKVTVNRSTKKIV
jgi:hypothetical protein